jgi:hypothetical protein
MGDPKSMRSLRSWSSALSRSSSSSLRLGLVRVRNEFAMRIRLTVLALHRSLHHLQRDRPYLLLLHRRMPHGHSSWNVHHLKTLWECQKRSKRAGNGMKGPQYLDSEARLSKMKFEESEIKLVWDFIRLQGPNEEVVMRASSRAW